MNKREEERKIIREIIEYAYDENIEHNAEHEEIEKIREWIIRIVKLEAKELGYETQIILGEINREKFKKREDKGELYLRFSRSNIDEEAGHFSVDISDEFSTPRAPELYINENYHEYLLENNRGKPIDPFIGMIDTVFHELRHMRQYLMARTGVSSYMSLIYAKEDFIINKYHKIYKNNHDSMKFEEDAMIDAIKNWKDVYDAERRKQNLYSSMHKICITKKQRDDFAFDMFDKLMKKKENRYILEIYPVLQKEYNEDGTKKSLNQVVENMKAETEEISNSNDLSDSEKDLLIKDCKEMYFEILYRGIKKNATFQEINDLADLYDKDDKTALFSEMKVFFEERFNNEKKDIEETGYNGLEEQEKELELREKYYKSRTQFLDLLVDQQQNENFLNSIINKGKQFVRIRKDKFIMQ